MMTAAADPNGNNNNNDTSSTDGSSDPSNATAIAASSTNETSGPDQISNVTTFALAATSCGPAPFQPTINTPAAYDWSSFPHDAAHPGQILMPAPFTNHQLGTGKVRGAVAESITTGGNMLYAEATSTLYAMNSSTFAQFWSFQAPNKPQFTTSATYSGGNLYVGTSDGHLYSISASSGQQNWVYPTTGNTIAIDSNPAVDNGLVIFGADDGNVYAVSASTGALHWSFLTGGPVRSSPAVSNGVVAIGSDDHTLHLINEQSGSQIGSYTTGGAIESSPAFGNGAVYVGSSDTHIYAVNPNTGSLIWESVATGGAVTASPAISTTGNIFVGSQDGMYAFDSSGNVLWHNSQVGAVSASGAIGEGVNKMIGQSFIELVYVPSTGGILYAIETDNGVVTWQLAVAVTASESASLAYTKLYIGDSSGVIHQIGALRFATPVGTFPVQSSYPSTGTITVGANAAWGKLGIRGYIVNVTSPGKTGSIVLCNAQMTFTPATTQSYNLYFTWNYQNLQPGTYKINVAIEDANPKLGSNNPRCCGWVNFKTTFTVAA